MRGPSCALFLCMTGALTSGCVNPNLELEKEMSNLRREVRTLTKKIADNELKMQQLEGRMEGMQVAPAPKTPVAGRSGEKSPPKIAAVNGPRKQLPVVKLSNDRDAVAYAGALDDGSPPIVIKLGPSEDAPVAGDSLTVDKGVLDVPDPVLSRRTTKKRSVKSPSVPSKNASKAEIRAAYEIARAKLRIEKKPAEARALFEKFAARFPDSRYADNVAFWLGECDYAQKRYESAYHKFSALIASHPRSPKVPHALLRSADASEEIGEQARSQRLLKKIVKEHPDSEAAGVAQARLAAFGGRR